MRSHAEKSSVGRDFRRHVQISLPILWFHRKFCLSWLHWVSSCNFPLFQSPWINLLLSFGRCTCPVMAQVEALILGGWVLVFFFVFCLVIFCLSRVRFSCWATWMGFISPMFIWLQSRYLQLFTLTICRLSVKAAQRNQLKIYVVGVYVYTDESTVVSLYLRIKCASSVIRGISL